MWPADMGTAYLGYFIWDLGRIWARAGYGHGLPWVLYLESGPDMGTGTDMGTDMGTAGYGHGLNVVLYLGYGHGADMGTA